MAGRRIEGESDARACLAAARASRQTLAEWCQRSGVDGRSLNAWRMNLKRGTAVELGAGRPRLVELVVVAPSAPAADSGRLTVRCGPFVVEADAAFDEALLVRVLGVLARC